MNRPDRRDIATVARLRASRSRSTAGSGPANCTSAARTNSPGAPSPWDSVAGVESAIITTSFRNSGTVRLIATR